MQPLSTHAGAETVALARRTSRVVRSCARLVAAFSSPRLVGTFVL